MMTIKKKFVISFYCFLICTVLFAVQEDLIAEEYIFEPKGVNPQSKAFIEKRKKGTLSFVETVKEETFKKCETLGLEINLDKIPEFSYLKLETKAEIISEAEGTVRAIKSDGGCQVFYDIPHPEILKASMIIEVYAQKRVSHIKTDPDNISNKDKIDQDMQNLCSSVLSETTPEIETSYYHLFSIDNTSKLSSCIDGVPFRMTFVCEHPLDKRCTEKNKPLIQSIFQAIEIAFVPN